MPDITDPQLVKFANERCRPTADISEQLYQTCKRFQQEWVGYSAQDIPNVLTDFFLDGSAVDGRKPFSGGQAHALKALADAMVTWFETAVVIGGVNATRIVHLQQFSVNGQAKF